jgi:hypothetical protein
MPPVPFVWRRRCNDSSAPKTRLTKLLKGLINNKVAITQGKLFFTNYLKSIL